MSRDFEPDPELEAVARRLEGERPVPAPAFRGDLRRRLISRQPVDRLPPYRALAASYSLAGALLLTVAAVGLVGAGPFAA